ncbi:MAG: response regulator [Candidatus Saganbacteria bacterium]|nr:response regulator [Candidatus Saganbacteria bacterium]
MAKHILVIDDQESMLTFASDMLLDKGYKVTSAKNGEEGLKAFRENPSSFDLVLVDVNMPKIDGFEVMKTIKKESSKTPVILLTGTNETIAQIIEQEYKGDGLIKKPFKVEDALDIIEKNLS